MRTSDIRGHPRYKHLTPTVVVQPSNDITRLDITAPISNVRGGDIGRSGVAVPRIALSHRPYQVTPMPTRSAMLP